MDTQPLGFDERYYHFDLWGSGWSPPGIDDEGVLARYAVNRLTAEVWNTYADCWVVHFSALSKMQQDYRRRYHLPDPAAIPGRSRPPRLC